MNKFDNSLPWNDVNTVGANKYIRSRSNRFHDLAHFVLMLIQDQPSLGWNNRQRLVLAKYGEQLRNIEDADWEGKLLAWSGRIANRLFRELKPTQQQLKQVTPAYELYRQKDLALLLLNSNPLVDWNMQQQSVLAGYRAQYADYSLNLNREKTATVTSWAARIARSFLVELHLTSTQLDLVLPGASRANFRRRKAAELAIPVMGSRARPGNTTQASFANLPNDMRHEVWVAAFGRNAVNDVRGSALLSKYYR